MNKFIILGTWRMSYAGIKTQISNIKNNKSGSDIAVGAISYIEDFEFFKSVGYGGLPNEDGKVKLDAAYMDGKTLSVGAVMDVEGFRNPIKIAKKLSEYKYNTMLTSAGAEKFAENNKFEKRDMLTSRALRAYEKKKIFLTDNPELSPYDGHDTVNIVCMDNDKNIFVATSTSGLFMKKSGRIGDSPLSGSGFYADNEIGAASATGLGEDIAKGILSFEIVKSMKDGLSPMTASQEALNNLTSRLERGGKKLGPVSLIAIDNNGKWGVATNCLFQFTLFSEKMKEPILYIASPNSNFKNTVIEEAPRGYWEDYEKTFNQDIKI